MMGSNLGEQEARHDLEVIPIGECSALPTVT
jgi:hypothetical protein